MTAARSHKGSAKPTTLAGGISNTATSFTVATGGGTGYPDGSGGVFIVTLDALNASEEKILCSARTGDTFTVSGGGRGYDDTTATSHVNNASVRHTFSAIEASEANAHILASTGVHGIADTSLLLTTAAGNAAYAPLSGSAVYAPISTSMKLLATTTSLGSVDFTSIPQTYKHLLLVIQGATNRAAEFDSERMNFNGDTAANYDFQYASWTSAAADTPVEALAQGYIEAATLTAASSPGSGVGVATVLIGNYTDTNRWKSITGDGAYRGNARLRRIVLTGVWKSTAAINRIQISHIGTPLTGFEVSLIGIF